MDNQSFLSNNSMTTMHGDSFDTACESSMSLYFSMSDSTMNKTLEPEITEEPTKFAEQTSLIDDLDKTIDEKELTAIKRQTPVNELSEIMPITSSTPQKIDPIENTAPEVLNVGDELIKQVKEVFSLPAEKDKENVKTETAKPAGRRPISRRSVMPTLKVNLIETRRRTILGPVKADNTKRQSVIPVKAKQPAPVPAKRQSIATATSKTVQSADTLAPAPRPRTRLSVVDKLSAFFKTNLSTVQETKTAKEVVPMNRIRKSFIVASSKMSRTSIMPTQKSGTPTKIPVALKRRSVLPPKVVEPNVPAQRKTLSVRSSPRAEQRKAGPMKANYRPSILPSTKSSDASETSTNDEVRGSAFICVTCSKQFRLKSNLMLHQRSHVAGTKVATTNKCKYCDKSFVMVNALDNHLKRMCAKIPEAERKKILSPERSALGKRIIRKSPLPSSFRKQASTPNASGITATGSTVSVKQPPHSGLRRTPTRVISCNMCGKTFPTILAFSEHGNDECTKKIEA